MSKLDRTADADLRQAHALNEKLIAELIRRDADGALRAAKGNPHLGTPLLAAGAKVLATHNGAAVRYPIGNSWGDAAEAVEHLKQTPDGAKLFSAAFSSRNPYSKNSFNLTEQGRLEKSDPALAMRLKLEAQA